MIRLNMRKESYEGGAGPSEAEVLQRDNELKALLDAHKVVYTYDDSFSQEIGADSFMACNIYTPAGGVVHVGYDRWGYVLEGTGAKGFGVDQGTLGGVLDALRHLKVIQ